MLLSALHEVTPGAILGAIVPDPRVPGHDLLRAGVVLDERMIASLKTRGVADVWVEDGLTADLDAAVAPKLAAARRDVYCQLRDGLAACARGTLSTASVQNYRHSVMALVGEAISSAAYASMSDALFGSPGQDAHGTNVAYLSLLIGLHLEEYVMSEQARLTRQEARDMSVLGMSGLMHDIGKTRLGQRAALFHDLHAAENGGNRERPEKYLDHAALGHRLLEDSRVPARVAHAVLNHHQRFDGAGWPDLAAHTSGRIAGTLSGRRIHIFARIVAAANVLDNLMRDADGNRLPPVAALHAFASDRFDGWFDPIVRRAALLRIPPFAIGTSVRLSDGRAGVVIAPEPTDPCRPKVRVALPKKDKSGAPSSLTIDLRTTPGLAITHALGQDVGKYIYAVPPEAPLAPAATDAMEAEAAPVKHAA